MSACTTADEPCRQNLSFATFSEFGAGDGSRTRTLDYREADFKSAAYAISPLRQRHARIIAKITMLRGSDDTTKARERSVLCTLHLSYRVRLRNASVWLALRTYDSNRSIGTLRDAPGTSATNRGSASPPMRAAHHSSISRARASGTAKRSETPATGSHWKT